VHALWAKRNVCAVQVAQAEQRTFTDLIWALTQGCRTDVDKARAIYRWITIKNLNLMQFDGRTDPNTPMGLLRGIKYGTESYHVLFKRLCRYVRSFSRYPATHRVQLCRPALRRHQRLQQVGRLSTGRALRRQSLPKHMERRILGRRMAICAVQLGRATLGECKRWSTCVFFVGE
jgi:hypothetical protein